MTELTVTVRAPFPDVVAATRAALGEQGFGVLTEIDVTATMKAKLDAELEDFVILGACNPPLAHRALQADRQVGVFLPCNVVVRRQPVASGSAAQVVVEAVDPLGMVALAPQASADLKAVADEAEQRLRAAVSTIPERVAAPGT